MFIKETLSFKEKKKKKPYYCHYGSKLISSIHLVSEIGTRSLCFRGVKTKRNPLGFSLFSFFNTQFCLVLPSSNLFTQLSINYTNSKPKNDNNNIILIFEYDAMGYTHQRLDWVTRKLSRKQVASCRFVTDKSATFIPSWPYLGLCLLNDKINWGPTLLAL